MNDQGVDFNPTQPFVEFFSERGLTTYGLSKLGDIQVLGDLRGIDKLKGFNRFVGHKIGASQRLFGFDRARTTDLRSVGLVFVGNLCFPFSREIVARNPPRPSTIHFERPVVFENRAFYASDPANITGLPR